MYYRLEQERDYFLIKHVETDREVGYAFFGQSIRPDGSTFDVCRILNNAGRELGRLRASHVNFQFDVPP